MSQNKENGKAWLPIAPECEVAAQTEGAPPPSRLIYETYQRIKNDLPDTLAAEILSSSQIRAHADKESAFRPSSPALSPSAKEDLRVEEILIERRAQKRAKATTDEAGENNKSDELSTKTKNSMLRTIYALCLAHTKDDSDKHFSLAEKTLKKLGRSGESEVPITPETLSKWIKEAKKLDS